MKVASANVDTVSRRLGPKAFTRTERTQKFKKNQLRGIWCHDMTKKAQNKYCKKVSKYKNNMNWKGSRCNDVEAVDQSFGAGFSGKLIKHSMKFASTSTILPRTCGPQGPLTPRKSAKENWKCPVVNCQESKTVV